MIPPKAKLSPSEIAMIELMKLDDGYADYREDVDLSVPFEVREHYNAAPEKFLPRLVAERAKLYCRKKMQIPVDEVQAKWMHWVVVLAVFTFGSFLFFSIVTALGVPAMFFSGEKREASVLAVSVLIGVMTLPCLIPALSLLSLIFQRLTGRPQAAIADVILWIIRTCRDAWASLRGRALPSQQKTPNRFASMFRRNSYFASASTVFLSNLYFVLMGIAIWGVLWLFLFSRNVNYVHESSLSTAEERASFIESAGRPVTWITGTPAPDSQAMQWAGGTHRFDEEEFVREKDGKKVPWSEAEIEKHKNQTISGFRRAWSKFLLSSVWTWVFLPRVAVALVAGACMLWFKRDFVPTHSDPNNRLIVDHIRSRRSVVEEVEVEQAGLSDAEDDPPQSAAFDPVETSNQGKAPVDEQVRPREVSIVSGEPTSTHLDVESGEAGGTRTDRRSPIAASQPNVVPNTTNKSDKPAGEEPSSARKKVDAERVVVVGFGLNSNADDSPGRLANLDRRFVNCGNLNGAKPQIQFRSKWQSDEFLDSSLVILASLTSVPTVSFGEFLEHLVATTNKRAHTSHTKIHVVLTDGKQTRERLGDDPDAFETRVSQWMGRIVEAGVDQANIHEFDQSTDAGASSARKVILTDMPGDGESALQVAGKSGQAIDSVRKHFEVAIAASKTEDAYDWSGRLAAISDDLGTIYREERRSLLKFLDGKSCSDSVKSAIGKMELPSGMMPDDLQTISKAMDLFKTVSPKWIGAGALGGFGLGTVAGVAAVATGGAALLPIALSVLPYSVLGGAAAGQVAKTFAFSPPAKKVSQEPVESRAERISIEAEQTLQASILQIIVLELQGNSENVITQQLRDQTQRIDHHQLKNMKDIEAMLSDFASGMSALGGNQ